MIRNAPKTIGMKNGQEADAARDLWRWFNETGNAGDEMRLEQDRRYRVDYPVYVDPFDRFFDQNGAQLIRPKDPAGPPDWYPNMQFPRSNMMLVLRGTDQLWYSSRPGARIQGPARRAQGKDYGIRFVAKLEAQHAISFQGTNDGGPATRAGVCVKNIDVGFVQGDLVYWWGETVDCEVTGDPTRGIGGGANLVKQPDGTYNWEPDGSWRPGLHHAGRQLAAFNGTNPKLYDVALWRGGRSCFDIEPPGSSSFGRGVRIGPRVRVADYSGTFLAGIGKGQVHDAKVADVVTNKSLTVNFGREQLVKRHGLSLTNCEGQERAAIGSCTSPGALMRIYNTDGIEIAGNRQRYQEKRCMRMVALDDRDVTAQYPDNEWVSVP